MCSGTSVLLRSCACARFTDHHHLGRPSQCVWAPIREKSSQARTSSAPLFVLVVGQASYFQSPFCSLVVMRDGDTLTGPSADGCGGSRGRPSRGPSRGLLPLSHQPQLKTIKNLTNTYDFTTSYSNLMRKWIHYDNVA